MKECPACKRCFLDELNHCPDDGNGLVFSIEGETVIEGRYEIESRLGQGGMAIVFKARHIFLKTPCAIKVILPDLVGNDPMLETRFRQLAMLAAQIGHRNIVDVTDFGVAGGTMPYLVMDFIEGQTLQDVLRQEGRLSPERALEIMAAVCAGVGAAHQQGVVHGDLKPLKILIQEGEPFSEGVKVLDFGLTKIKSGELLRSTADAQSAVLTGSPFYIAPELWSDQEPDKSADIYSMGVILFQILAGDVPFNGDSISAIMKKHLADPPPSFGQFGVSVPPALEAVVWHALAKNPQDRQASVDEFLRELRAAIPNSRQSISSPMVDERSHFGADTSINFAAPGSANGAESVDQMPTPSPRTFEDEAARLALEFEEAQRRADEARRRAEQAELRRAEKEALRRAEREAAKRAEEEAIRMEESKRRAAEKEAETRQLDRSIAEAQGRTEDELLLRTTQGLDREASLLARAGSPMDEMPPESAVSSSPQPYDDDVMFTAYRPRTVVPQKWYSLLAFAHLSERRPDAPADEPDPLVEVQRQAQQILAEAIDDYKASEESGASVPRGGEIIFQPFVEGVEFNPPTRTFRWEESVHREEFKLRASPSLDGQVARGWLRVYLGPLILAQINLAIKVDSKHLSTADKQSTTADSARPLRKVFASYSHRDLAIVEQIEKMVYEAHLGVQYLRDATTLRAGEVWNEALMRMIKEADMFQLFWSTNSMYSPFVRQEYQYALSLGKPQFVLPVYWETPFPQKPEENLPPDELLRLHFEKLNESTASDRPKPPDACEPVASQIPTTTLSSYDGGAESIDEEVSRPADRSTLDLAAPTEIRGSDQSIASEAPTSELVEPTRSFTADRNLTSPCPECGASVRRLARFCARCGASQQAAEEQKNTAALRPPAPPSTASARPPLIEMSAPARDYPTLGSASSAVTGSLPDAPSFAPAPPSAPLPAPKSSSKTAVIGLAVAGLAFLIFIPIVLVVAAGTMTLGSPGGSGSELPLLFVLIFLLAVGGLLLLGGIVLFLFARKRQ